jgi:hypothetical protein
MPIKTFTNEQIKELLAIERGKEIGRIICNRKAVDLSTGELVGGNVIYHPVYWDRTKDFFRKAVEYLTANNEGLKFRVEYSK